ncbi:hypothetical protein F511_05656 [Dorcoceras hygrometricum]|uniref:Uncharacterized protein n=1 Tax=Dorcoceras hygrometricum TaxID=472368 RepID=A0A2Z7B9J7_9LAMI|nr:hypothetical protein F511_05656 [Dorcoceras hygrometricum]
MIRIRRGSPTFRTLLAGRGPRGPDLEGLNEELYQMVLTSKPKMYAEVVDNAIDIEEGLQSRRARSSRQRRLVVLLVREHSLLSLRNQPISPHGSRWHSSLAVRGFDPAVSSSRRSGVLALLVQAAQVAVVLGLSSVVFAVGSIHRPSLSAFRALAISVASLDISLACVRQRDRSRPQPRLRVVEDSLGVIPLSFSSLGWVRLHSVCSSSLVRRDSDSHVSLSTLYGFTALML